MYLLRRLLARYKSEQEKPSLDISKKLKSTITYEIRDVDGKLVRKETFPCNSWTARLAELLYSFINLWMDTYTSATGYVASTPLLFSTVAGYSANLNINTSSSAHRYGVKAPAGVDYAGIVVGSDSTAVSLTNIKLLNQITQAYLDHGAVSTSYSSTATSFTIQISRTFTNSAATSITIREIGIYMAIVNASGYQDAVCLARDVPPTSIVLQLNQTLTITYTISYSI